MSAPTVLRSPADAEQFRVKVGRYGDRWYHDPLPACELAPATDESWPSASIVKGAWPKFLQRWTAQKAAECAVDELAVWQAIPDRAARVDYIARASDRSRDQSAGRGTAVHKALEALIVGGDIDALTEVDAGAWLPAARQFVTECQPQLVVAEAVSISRTLGVGGTLDAIATFPGLGTRLVDYKTRQPGKHGAYDDEGAQLGLYAQPDSYLIVERDGRAVRVPMPDLDGGLIVSIAPDGYRLYPVDLGDAVELAQRLHGFWRAKTTSPIGKPVVVSLPANATAVSPQSGQAPPPAPAVASPDPVPPQSVASCPDPTVVAWVRDRIVNLIDAGHGDKIAANWPTGVPTLKQGGHTVEQIDQIDTAVAAVERAVDAPFPERRPGSVNDLLDGYDTDMRAVLLDGKAPGDLTASEVERLAVLVAAVDRCIVGFTYGDDRPVLLTLEKAETVLLDGFGNKTRAVSAAKAYATAAGRPAPKAFAQVLADPATVAALTFDLPDQTPKQGDTPK